MYRRSETQTLYMNLWDNLDVNSHNRRETYTNLVLLSRVLRVSLVIFHRINICRKNVDETRELLMMIKGQFNKFLSDPPPEYDQLVCNMLQGLWYGCTNLDEKAFLTLTYHMNNVKREYLTFIPIIIHAWSQLCIRDVSLELVMKNLHIYVKNCVEKFLTIYRYFRH